MYQPVENCSPGPDATYFVSNAVFQQGEHEIPYFIFIISFDRNSNMEGGGVDPKIETAKLCELWVL